jgi:hypothetical protein
MSLFTRHGPIAVFAACCMIGFFAIGCGSPTPSAVVKTFHTALLKGDMETAGKNCTPETLQMVATFNSKLQPMLKGKGKITSATETITGDEAKVEVKYENGDSDTYDLVKVDGKWKVHEDMKSGK